jgi:hypothetical protein
MGESAIKKTKKVPIQIYLEPEQDEVLRHLCRASGRSRAAIIRESIEQYIAGLPPEKDPALGIVNLGASGKSDIAEKHDMYLISSVK